jgi:hypothetical protein
MVKGYVQYSIFAKGKRETISSIFGSIFYRGNFARSGKIFTYPAD